VTPAQQRLLKSCIDADRRWRSNHERYRLGQDDAEYRSHDERGVEVNDTFTHSRRTAQSLEGAGLIECVNLYGNKSTWAFLGRYQPHDS
jgi:hypothetical protein